MASLSDLYAHFKTLCEQWFYNKSEVDTALDGKISKSQTQGLVKNDGSIDTNTYLTTHQDISGKEDTSNKVTSWSSTTTDAHYPSEKLVKSSLDGKAASSHNHTKSEITDFPTTMPPSSHTHGNLSNDGKIGSASGKIITTGTSGTLQASDSITKSMISDFPTSMTPTSHTHGNLSNDGKLGTTSGKPVITTTGGAVTTGSFGTSSGTFAEGNHTHSQYVNPTKVISWSSTPSNDNVASEKLIKDSLDAKANANSIPTKTSDLTNDGADGTNVFVANNDSRLSDARTPTSHTHGQVTNDGAITSTAVTVASNDNIVITDSSDSNKIKRVANILASQIKDSNAYSAIGSSANDTQATINSKINDALSSLSSIDVINVVTDKGTASADTMHKLYIVSEDNKVNVYYTVQTGTGSSATYSWHKMDADILDELSIDWSDITNKPTIPTDVSDLTDTQSTQFTPKSHTHGNITNDGKVGSTANYFVYTSTGGAVTSKQKIGNITTSGAIGSTANLPLITTTSGVVTTGSFGTAANTFCQGNDSRLSDARTPTSHTHGNITNDGKISTDVTFNSKIVVTNSSNVVGTATAIDVMDNVVQALIDYGSS